MHLKEASPHTQKYLLHPAFYDKCSYTAEGARSFEAVFAATAMLAKASFFPTLCIDRYTLAKPGSREQPNVCYEHGRVCKHTSGAACAAKAAWDRLM